jgi:hypothetical protein
VVDDAASEPLRSSACWRSSISLLNITGSWTTARARGALLLAAEFPFKRIIGLEFSPELHCIAEDNLRRCNSRTQKCRDIHSLNLDFTSWALLPGPSVLLFFNHCHVRVLSEVVNENGRSLISHPRSRRFRRSHVRANGVDRFRRTSGENSR